MSTLTFVQSVGVPPTATTTEPSTGSTRSTAMRTSALVRDAATRPFVRARLVPRRAAGLAVAALLAAVGGVRAQQVIASLEPTERVAFELLADTDGDGRGELVLVLGDGEVRRHGLAAGDAARALAVTGTLRLRDPEHSLLALADIAPSPGVELVVADARGTAIWPWPANGAAAEPRVIARTARCTLRVDRPRQSPFVTDLDRDGRFDLLLPTLQGCVPFLQEAPAAAPGGGAAAGEAAAPAASTSPADGATLRFRALPALPLPVRVDVDVGDGSLDDDHQGGLVVPQLERLDLNGDGKPDLVTREGQQQSFHLQQPAGGFAPPIVVDTAQFQDSTPSAQIAPGSVLVVGEAPMLQRGDVDGDTIPDFVVAHRRKVWTFLSSKAGPQFTKARTQAVADDVSAMLLVDLDEDKSADLLAFQVQLPGIGAILLGLVQSIDIDVKAVGYRAENGAFASIPAMRRTVTLRVPPLLSLLARQEELVKRFLGILGKARASVRGAFASATPTDLALVSADGTQLELFPMTEVPTLGSAAGRRQLRELLFEDPNPVFDLDRLFGLVEGVLDQRAATLTGAAKPAVAVALRDANAWTLVRLHAAELDGVSGDEVVLVYVAVGAPERLAFDVVGWRAR